MSVIGNLLKKISNVIDFEVFRQTLELKILNTEKKIMQKPNKLSFKKILGIESGDKIPDEKTEWLFHNRLINRAFSCITYQFLIKNNG